MAEQSRAEKLLAEMDAKYGKTSGNQPTTAPQPAPVQAPPPVQQQPGSMIQRAVGIIGGRKEQIDKAAGYSCGGKVKAHAQGGKIAGPGTAKSDSIPAKIKETNEPILVSNGERIVSAKQDQILQRIAEMLGFETVDAMFEQMTGEPVGPTMKDGVPAAAGGMAPWYEKDPLTALSSAVNESMAKAGSAEDYQKSLYPKGTFDSAQQQTSTTPSPMLGTQNNFGQVPSVGTGSEIGKAPAPVVKPGYDANGLVTADSAASASASPMMRSGGVTGSYDGKGVNDILARENAAREGMINSMIQAQGGNGVGLLSSGVSDQIERDNAEKTQRWRNDELMGLATRGNQAAAIEAMRANADPARIAATVRDQDLKSAAADQRNQVDMRGQDLRLQGDLARSAKDPLEQRINALKASDAETISGLRSQYLDPKATPEQKATALAHLNALSGKGQNENFKIATVRKPDPNNPGQYVEEAYVVNGQGGQNERRVGGQPTYQKGHVVTDKGGAKWAYKGTGDVNDQNNWEKV
jgi:hypothetical protein